MLSRSSCTPGYFHGTEQPRFTNKQTKTDQPNEKKQTKQHQKKTMCPKQLTSLRKVCPLLEMKS